MPERPRPPSPIVITGATGFIGRHLQAGLLRDGYRVRALLRPDSRHRDRVQPEVEAVTVSLTAGVEALGAALRDAGAVVYCAGSVRGRKMADFEPANVDGVAAVAAALKELPRPPPLLLISSLAATRPEVSYYARSKFDGEKVLESCPEIPWTVLRPPAVYGPGDKEMRPLLGWARRGLLPVVGPRSQRVSLLNVSDLARAVSAWLAALPNCRHRVFAIDDGRPGGYDWDAIGRAAGARRVRLVTVPRALLRLVAAANWALSGLLGYAPMLTPGKARELSQPDWLADNAEFSAATGWQPRIGLERGIGELFG